MQYAYEIDIPQKEYIIDIDIPYTFTQTLTQTLNKRYKITCNPVEIVNSSNQLQKSVSYKRKFADINLEQSIILCGKRKLRDN